MKGFFYSLALLAFTKFVQSADLPAIEVKGNAFWDTENNQRFYIRGVDYQPGGPSNLIDPLADKEVCERDIKLFEELGINTIRIYSVDSTQDHDYCMNLLTKAGIYLVLDLNLPGVSLNRESSRIECSYNQYYLRELFGTIDAFSSYTNVLGYFAANEVINDDETTNTAPYIKAVVRDLKNYMKSRKYRQVPVGYSAADVEENREEVAAYFNCGTDEMARSDFLGINDYSWCGESTFKKSGWDKKVKMYENYSIPIFLSEFGCNEVKESRPFNEIEALYSKDMTHVFSGGLVYEYSMEDNNYGLVEINDDESIKKLSDFENLKKMYASVSNPSGDGGYTESNNISTCPSSSTNWEPSARGSLPDMPEGAEDYLKNGAGEVFGFDLENSQWMCYEGADADASAAYIDGVTGGAGSSTRRSSSRSSSGSSSAADSDDETSSVSTSSADAASNLYNPVRNLLNNHNYDASITVSVIGFISALTYISLML
ncbi:glycoside hydrolase family 72 protein [Ascoidea rubescens DSM 1968]|uniref:1,3-beta-glucanosyltransferase n=1 Tax=Ascoidea rubescens DSM 1968 TaxID=1344418 RepID=A0A1D2VRP9_9ASCO|nr:glycoside hydrolase family 72 protein [Ascoidea rubescens DSM 1968]ODV64270.1 glycoside hydrolase family 72 protein [Ascoidea rubescens DSM 1968]